MRTAHFIHILAMFILFGLGLYYLRQYNLAIGRIEILALEASGYGVPSFEYGFISLGFFVLTTILGLWTRTKMQKTGNLLTLGGGGFAIWSVLMINSPKHIGIHEVFPAWCVWMLIAIVLNGIAYLRADVVDELFFDDDILDDYIN